MRCKQVWLGWLLVTTATPSMLLLAGPALRAAELAPEGETAAQRGYRLLTTKPYQPADFTATIFNDVWKTWPPAERAAAETATPAERRKMSFSR